MNRPLLRAAALIALVSSGAPTAGAALQDASPWPVIELSRAANGIRIDGPTTLHCGDRITVRFDPNEINAVTVNDSTGVVLAEPIVPGRLALFVAAEGEFTLRAGNPAWSMTFQVERPDLPPNPRMTTRALGPLFPHIGVPDELTEIPLDRYIVALDTTVRLGGSYLSICPIAVWTPYFSGSPFPLDENGVYDLSRFSQRFRLLLRTLFWRASRIGVQIHLYPFDLISLKVENEEFWARHPFNERSNNSARIAERGWVQNYAGPPWNQVEAAVVRGAPAFAREWLSNYARELTASCPPVLRERHAVVSILEGESREFESALHPLLPGGMALGSNLPVFWGLEPAARPLSADPQWRAFLGELDFVVQHSSLFRRIDYFRNLDALLGESRLGVLASTDGSLNPDGSRPTPEEAADIWRNGVEVFGDRFLGLELKVTSWNDFLAFLPAVKRRIGSLER